MPLPDLLQSASAGFTGALTALPIAEEHWGIHALATLFPFFFSPKNRTGELRPAEDVRVRPLDMHAGSRFLRVVGSRHEYFKKRPGIRLNVYLISDWSNDLKSGLKRVPGIVIA